MHPAIAKLRAKQAKHRARRDRERFYAAAAPFLCGALLTICAVPAAVLFGMAASVMSLRIAGL